VLKLAKARVKTQCTVIPMRWLNLCGNPLGHAWTGPEGFVKVFAID
jgi:hypothetical protein